MRRLIYWKDVSLPETPWSTFQLVPLQEIDESIYFNQMIDIVRKSGFDYKIIEITETLVEQNAV